MNIVYMRQHIIHIIVALYPIAYSLSVFSIFIPKRISYANHTGFRKGETKRAASNAGGPCTACGVGLKFVRDLEQGKKTLRLDKVNDVLALFGTEVGVIDKTDK